MEERICKRCGTKFQGEAWEGLCQACVDKIAGSQKCSGCGIESALMFTLETNPKMVECGVCGFQQLNRNL